MLLFTSYFENCSVHLIDSRNFTAHVSVGMLQTDEAMKLTFNNCITYSELPGECNPVYKSECVEDEQSQSNKEQDDGNSQEEFVGIMKNHSCTSNTDYTYNL